MVAEKTIQRKKLIKPSTKENLRRYWYNFKSNKLSLLGLFIVIGSIVLAIFAPIVAPYPGHAGAFVDYNNASMPPNSQNLFGTDIYGRDILSRIIFSFRSALIMPIVVLGISVPFGVLLGLIAGYYSGTWVDSIIMRIDDIFLAIPPMILALAIASVLEANLTSSMISVTVIWWSWYTRLVYGMANSYKKNNFVINADLIGASKIHILVKEILPNCLSPVFTKMALDVGSIILLGSSLSFVGLGEQPPTPAFGQMIYDGSNYMPDLWWMTIYPSLAIVVIILGFNLLGDGVRDMMDRGRQ